MTEKKEDQLPGVLTSFRVRSQRYFAQLEKRLAILTKQQLIVLVVAIGLLALLLGVALGFLLGGSLPIKSSGNDHPSSTNSQPKTVSETGVLRKFRDSQDGINFYLEKQGGTQVLLDFGDQFDPSFIQQTYESAVVTIEGTMTKSANGTKDILQVEKIVIKR